MTNMPLLFSWKWQSSMARQIHVLFVLLAKCFKDFYGDMVCKFSNRLQLREECRRGVDIDPICSQCVTWHQCFNANIDINEWNGLQPVIIIPMLCTQHLKQRIITINTTIWLISIPEGMRPSPVESKFLIKSSSSKMSRSSGMSIDREDTGIPECSWMWDFKCRTIPVSLCVWSSLIKVLTLTYTRSALTHTSAHPEHSNNML